MSLDMYGHIDSFLDSGIDVTLITPGAGDYSGPGGIWVGAPSTEEPLNFVNVQPANYKTVENFTSLGGTVNPTDFRICHINDGTMIYPDDDGKHSQFLRFTDGIEQRLWRVRDSDCRPSRNFCKIIVERFRGSI